MKKMLVCAVLLAMLCVGALAEESTVGIDLSGMDLEELMVLHAEVDQAIKSLTACDLEGEVIQTGIYISGLNIEPGVYVLTNVGEDNLYIFTGNPANFNEENEDQLLEFGIEPGGSCRVVVDDEHAFGIGAGDLVSAQKVGIIGSTPNNAQ